MGVRKPRKRVATAAPKGLAATAATGDVAATLARLRDHLATAIETADPSLVAGLTARLLDTLAKLAALPAPAKGTPVDEVAAGRAARGRPAARRARTTG